MGHLFSILTLCNKSVYVTLYWFLLHSPVTNLCILTSDRYINIVQPFRHPNSMTSKKPWNSHFYVVGNSFDHFAGYFGRNARYELIHNFKNLADNRSLSFWHICVCVLLSYAVARILIVARAKANGDSTFRKAVRSLELREGYNCFSKKTALIFKRKKHREAYFIIAIVALFLHKHAAEDVGRCRGNMWRHRSTATPYPYTFTSLILYS